MKPEEFMVGTRFKSAAVGVRIVDAIGSGIVYLVDDNGVYCDYVRLDHNSFWKSCTLVSQPYATPVKMFPQRKVYCWDDNKEAKEEGLLVDIRENPKRKYPFIVRFKDGEVGNYKHIEEIPAKEPEITITEFLEKHGGKKFKESELLKLLESES